MFILFIFNHQNMLLIFFFYLLILTKINGKFFLNTNNSSIIVIRHIRLNTDNEYYRIRCPYNLKHLTLTLLNYSNNYCFNLYTKSIQEFCINNYQSPCRFHSKPIQLNCHNRLDSNHVDISYQCSMSSLTTINNTTATLIDKEISFLSSSSSETGTIHALSFSSTSFGIEESIGLFVICLTAVFILWLTVCCVWLIRYGHINNDNDDDDDDDDGKCELLSIRPYQKNDMMNFTIVSERKPMIVGNLSSQINTGGIENVCLHVNPLENKPISSLKITQID